MNQGVCYNLEGEGYRCECEMGWRGAQCQFDANECGGQPCMNAVTCQNLRGDYVCACMPGWEGKNCDMSK